ncbi:hypothetical protein [Enterococcus massiliensis]|uniref:hypothetical protein n=1 Tax=Enterococcus massiliensis TaxID=1640685 RepID=UPI000A88465E|nr:hypothetical protein [Enterococcus massiliensis]
MKMKYIYIVALVLVIATMVLTLMDIHMPLLSSIVNLFIVALLINDISKENKNDE